MLSSTIQKNTMWACFSLRFFVLLGGVSALPTNNYWTQRASVIEAEDKLALGGRLQFQPGERIVDDILMSAKREELSQGFQSPSKFAPSRNFMDVRDDIENSEVYQLIRRMPKGAVLHSHDTTIASQEFVFNLTYRDNLYVCESGSEPGESLSLHFFEKPNNACDWKLLSDVRNDPASARIVNERINKQLSMYDPSAARNDYDNGDAAWTKFTKIFGFITPMLTYKPVYEDHFYQGLKQLHDDNVLFMEVRSTLPMLYELNGTEHSPVETARMYKEVTERFVRDHPKFVGMKLIYAPPKTADPVQFDEYLRVAKEVKRTMPDFFAGFDLVGQEDRNTPLMTWIDKIRTIADDIPFFFHAGETNWSGTNVDENLIDAVLLDTKRIGHGYALVKHPKVLEMVKEKGIAIEISPISNQVLCLVKDLRNHPASALFVDDFPVVVSNDDPGLWRASGLSYDFYEAFVGIMSAHADIRSIKQLAINSIKYSSLSDAEKNRTMSIWTEQWTAFVDSFYPETSRAFVLP